MGWDMVQQLCEVLLDEATQLLERVHTQLRIGTSSQKQN